MTVQAVLEAVQGDLEAIQDPPCRCPICLTGGHPQGYAYRPHTLTPDCWCMREPDGSPLKGRTKCLMQGFGEIPEGRLG